MQDIRDELKKRIELLELQMNGVLHQFEKQVEHLKQQRDNRITELRADHEMLGRVMRAEQRRYGGAIQPQQHAVVTELRQAG